MKTHGSLLRAFLATVAALTLAASAAAAEKAPPRRSTLTDRALTVDIVDMSPRFLAWYAAAKDVPDPDARFKLWQDLYGFAAAPPGPAGEAMSRKLVDNAWPRYAEALAPAEAGAAGMQPQPMAILQKVATVLGLKDPVHIQLITYIGGFEDNAFAYRGELPTVAIPLESKPEMRKLFVAHEGTHAIHMEVARLSGGWERSVAATMLQEGLAMHVTREVFPGLPIETYVSFAPGWWTGSQAKERAILQDLRGKLDQSDGATVMSVTIAVAPASGLNREAYYGGWRAVEQMRKDGLSLADIARIPEAEMPARVGKAVDELLAARDAR
jgi:hypothetical protein